MTTSSERKKTLVITESPSKARALNRIFKSQQGHTTAISCLGRLYELDPIHPDEFLSGESPLSWTPLKPGNLIFINNCLLDSDNVLIATDPDIEGEVIAWQILQLVERSQSSPSAVSRIHIHEMTPEGVLDSLARKTDIDIGKAQAGISRRIFDNFSRFAFSETSLSKYPYLKGGHGRVVTPVLGSLNDKPLKVAVVKYQRPGMPLPAYLEINATQDIDRVIRQMDRLPAPILKKIEESREAFPKEGLDYNTLISYATKVLREGPKEAYEGLQRLYEKGEISYFRTDSRSLSPLQIQHLKRSLAGEGAVSFSAPESSERERDQGGHFAITPLREPNNPWEPMNNKDIEDKLLSLIWRYWTLHTQDRSIIRKTGRLEENAFENKVWQKLKKECRLDFREDELENSYGKRSKYDDVFLPLGIKAESRSSGNAIVRKYTPQVSLIERMIQIGVSRPSTLISQAQKIAKNFLSGHKVNKKGSSAINENRRENHPLLNAATARGIEEDLHQSHNRNDTAMVLASALNKSHFQGRNDYATKRQVNVIKEHTINWPGL